MKKTLSFLFSVVMILCFSPMVFAQDLPIIPISQSVKISGLSLALNGEIGLIYHIEVPATYQTGYVVLTCNGGNTVQVNISDCPTDSNNKYMATYNLSAIQLSEPVTVTVYSQSGEILKTTSKSAEDYVADMIKDSESTEKEIAVAKALINYGHYAQIACSEYYGWTIGIDYAETSAYSAPVATKAVFDSYNLKWEGTGIYDVAFQLILDYKTDMNIYFPAYETTPVVTINGATAETLSKCDDGRYKLSINSINIMNLDDNYEISVNDTLKFTASALTYGNLVMNNVSENTRLALLSMYEFYDATCAYNE